MGTSAEEDLLMVRRSAARGARSVTTVPQVVDDAVTMTIEAWENATISLKAITSLHSWSYRVAANAAKRLLSRTRSAALDDGDAMADGEPDAPAPQAGVHLRARLRQLTTCYRRGLTAKQFLVVSTLSRPGMTFHAAARHLRMDRSSLRRTLRRAEHRLRRCAAADGEVRDH